MKASRKFVARNHKSTLDKGTSAIVTAAVATTNHSYFSVQCDEYKSGHLVACGCQHEKAARLWPAIKPVIALHLSDSTTGEPMHAVANAVYWLEGAMGIKETHVKGTKENFSLLLSHLRISEKEGDEMLKWGNLNEEKDIPEFVATYVDTLRPRWKAEAEAAVKLIQSLAL